MRIATPAHISHSISVLACGVILIFNACNAQKPSINAIKSDSVVVSFGDSLTSGTGAEPNDSYPSVLGRIIHRKVINAGLPGELSNDGLARLPAVIAQYKPGLVILCHGGNDLLQRVAHEQIKENLSRMIQMLKHSGSDVILIGVPEPTLILSTAGFYRDLAREYSLPYEGKVLQDIFSNPAMKSDRIHPNSKGYRILAESIAALIQQLKAI